VYSIESQRVTGAGIDLGDVLEEDLSAHRGSIANPAVFRRVI
jgi:hypothetical protein